jgi:hypothetical protein
MVRILHFGHWWSKFGGHGLTMLNLFAVQWKNFQRPETSNVC